MDPNPKPTMEVVYNLFDTVWKRLLGEELTERQDNKLAFDVKEARQMLQHYVAAKNRIIVDLQTQLQEEQMKESKFWKKVWEAAEDTGVTRSTCGACYRE